MNIFYDASNEQFTLDDRISDLCNEMILPGYVDYNKLLCLAVGAKAVSRFYKDVRVVVVGDLFPTVRDFLKSLGEIENISMEFCPADANGIVQSLNEKRYNYIVYTESLYSPQIFPYIELLARHVDTFGAIYFAHFSDNMRSDASVSTASIVDALSNQSCRLLHAEYFALFQKLPNASQAYSTKLAKSVAPTPRYESNNRYCFIVGPARSGTSVAFQLLNEQPSIYVTYEANPFIRKGAFDFAHNYNKLQKKYGRKYSKGFFLPEGLGALSSFLDVYENILLNYTYTGDKVAFGPRSSFYDAHSSETARDFFQNYFPFSKYILTLRSPLSCVPASARIFPDTPSNLLLDSWVKSTECVLDIYAAFGDSRFLFHEGMDQKEFSFLKDFLNLETLKNKQEISRTYVTTNDSICKEYWSARVDERKCAESLSEWYESFRGLVDATSGQLREGVNHGELDEIRQKLRELAQCIEEEGKAK